MTATAAAPAPTPGSPAPAGGLLARVDGRLFAPGSIHRFATIRLLLAVVLLGRIALGPYARFADTPPEIWDPPKVLFWLSSVPSLGFIRVVQLVGILAAVAVIARRRERNAFLVAWLSLLVLAGLRDSVGKVMHNDVLLLVGSMPFVFGPLRARIGDARRSAAAGWPVRASAILIAMVYFWAGYQKLRFSGLAWVTGDNMRWTVYQASTTPLAKTKVVSYFIGDRPWMGHLLAGGALTLEMTAPLLIAHRWTRWLFMIGSLCLHTSIFATLGLDYWGWILTVWIVLAPWDGLVDRLGGRMGHRSTPPG